MSNYTFPTKEQFFDDEEMLEVIRKRGREAEMTDFSILLGGWVNDDSRKIALGPYWTKSGDIFGDVYAITEDGTMTNIRTKERSLGVRPALPFKSIDKIPMNGERGRRVSDGVIEVKYGFYPQSAVSKTMQQELEQQFYNDKLNSTGNEYTTDARRYFEVSTKFEEQRHKEFEYKGKRYIRVKAKAIGSYGDKFKLSNGERYINDDFVWIEVEPINWLVSEKDKLMITEKLIFAGVQFNYETIYRTEDFEKTDIKWFIDEYWSKDIEKVRSKRKNYKNRC